RSSGAEVGLGPAVGDEDDPAPVVRHVGVAEDAVGRLLAGRVHVDEHDVPGGEVLSEDVLLGPVRVHGHQVGRRGGEDHVAPVAREGVGHVDDVLVDGVVRRDAGGRGRGQERLAGEAVADVELELAAGVGSGELGGAGEGDEAAVGGEGHAVGGGGGLGSAVRDAHTGR